MEEIVIDSITWTAPEYTHKERTPDWFWTIGLVAIAACLAALWFHNYLFAIFILVSGACLILFTLREPQEINFAIETEGVTIGHELYEWKKIQGFAVKKGEPYAKLIIATTKHFLPVYTIPFPSELTPAIKESVIKYVPVLELAESPSMQFMEKIGF